MRTPRLISMMFLVLLLTASISCATDPAGPVGEPEAPAMVVRPNVLTGLLNGLLTCRPLPGESVSKVIGAAGGTINMGPHSLVIPRGALGSNVLITAQVVRDSVNSVRLLPEGLRFAKPANLTLSYGNCTLVGRLLPKKIVYTTEGLRVLEILQSLDNPLTQKVQAPLNHFSRYAVAY